MVRRKIVFSIIGLSVAVFVVQTLSQTQGSSRTRETPNQDRLQYMDAEQRRGEFERRVAQRRAELNRQRERRTRESQSRAAQLHEEAIKQALVATEQQWKIIKPKFEKVKTLLEQVRVNIGVFSYSAGGGAGSGGSSGGGSGGGGSGGGSSGFGGSSGGASGGRSYRGANAGYRTSGGGGSNTRGSEPQSWEEHGWRWSRPSSRKKLSELTEGEKIAEELLDLLEDDNSESEKIKQKMDALRKIREDANMQLVKARQELREVVTPRQEATLVLMGWLD
jgi:hypothetical protein